MKQIYFFLVFYFFTQNLHAQDLSGLWIGSKDAAQLYIIKHNNVYIGFTYDEGMGFCKCNFLGTFNTNTQKLKGENKGFIEKAGPHSQSRYNLKYSSSDGEEWLTGMLFAKTIGAKLMSFGLPQYIAYRKTGTQGDTTAYMLQYLAGHVLADSTGVATAEEDHVLHDSLIHSTELPIPASSIIAQRNSRRNDTLSVIETKSRLLEIKLMDNGIVDGDTVSVLHNGKVIAERILVSAKPFSFTIDTDPAHPVQEITLVAHNVGAIPPNTALVLVNDGEHQYRLNASADLSRNGVLIFRHKE